MEKKPKAVIFTSTDSVWLLPAWFFAVPRVAEETEIRDVWVFPDKLGKRNSGQMLLWYLNVFGIYSTVLLAVFALLVRVRLFFCGISNWQSLAKKYELNLHWGDNPNRPETVAWIRKNDIDLILSTTGFIFKPPLLSAPKIGSINKHASLLPSSKGIFPYIWSQIHGLPLGVSFHLMTDSIDGGELLFQKRLSGKELSRSNQSMVAFYIWIYGRFAEFLPLALRNLRSGERIPPSLPPSYFSLPNKNDMKSFKAKRARIVAFSDLFRSWPK